MVLAESLGTTSPAPWPAPTGTPLAALADDLRCARRLWFLADLAQLPADLVPATPFEWAEAEKRPPGPLRAGWLARRRLARHVLALAEPSSEETRIGRDALGRPVIEAGATGWHVSFAARESLGLIGIADRPLGVDLEIIRPGLMIPFNMLRPGEKALILALPEAERIGMFGRLWAAKEAIAKAMGTGFRKAPEDIPLPEAALAGAAMHFLVKSEGKRPGNHRPGEAAALTQAGLRVFVSQGEGEERAEPARLALALAETIRPSGVDPGNR